MSRRKGRSVPVTSRDEAVLAVLMSTPRIGGTATNARWIDAKAIVRALNDAGYRIVHPERSAEDCNDPWVCCIHEPPKDDE